MTIILLAVAIAVLALGLLVAFATLMQVARQNGRMLLRVDLLEQAIENGTFIRSHPWLSLREDCNDREILYEVVGANCYRLPAAFSEADVVIDIGTHVGIFAMAVLDLGCSEVHCFEPEPLNIEQALGHLAPYGQRARLTEAAVWRSDRDEPVVYFQPSTNPRNLGGGDVIHASGREVQALRFDDVLLSASQGGRKRIRYVKLDCEGSEYPILLTSKLLHLVDEVAGEYHTVPDEVTSAWNLGQDCTPQTLRSGLAAVGFDVEWAPSATDSNAAGMFYARRRA